MYGFELKFKSVGFGDPYYRLAVKKYEKIQEACANGDKEKIFELWNSLPKQKSWGAYLVDSKGNVYE